MACPNEIHNVLYSKARTVLNNNVKRLWFKINPFLERKDTLKGFNQPEELSKFVKLLQSSVVCEKYFSDETSTFQEVTIGHFWEFLYSDKWSHGCSVRILEGALLDYLMTALFVLEEEKLIARHNTLAFAKNQREKRGCYKLSNDEKGCQIIEETLLIEFTYFARKIDRTKGEAATSTPYPETTTESTFETITEEDGDEEQILPLPTKKRKEKNGVFKYHFDPYSSQTFKRNSIFSKSSEKQHNEDLDDIAKRLEYMVQSGYVKDENVLETTVQGWMGSDSSSGERETASIKEKQNVEIIPHIASDTRSSQASTDSDYKLKPFLANLNKLPCTEQVLYGDDFDEESEVEDSPLNTGNEFYLGEHLSDKSGEGLTVQQNLRLKLREKQKWREIKKNEETVWRGRRQVLPQYKEVDFDSFKIVRSGPTSPSKLPTFEEFLQLLEEEEKIDPRFHRAKQLSKKVAKRYNIQRDALKGKLLMLIQAERKTPPEELILPPILKNGKETNIQSSSSRRHYNYAFAEEVGGVTESKACERWVLSQEERERKLQIKRFSTIGDKTDRVTFLSPEFSPTNYNFDLLERHSSSFEVPLLILTTPSGTFMEMESPELEEKEERVDTLTPKIKETKAKIAPIVEKKKTKGFKKASVKTAKSRKSSVLKSRMSRRENALKPTIESSSDDSEPDIDTISEVFNSKKLNMKYSFERLKGKKQVKKKSSFCEVLKKYYKIQRALTKFQGGTTSPTKKGGRRKGIFARLMNIPIQEAKNDVPPLGKLKKFDFLKHKPTKPAEEQSISFESVSMATFTSHLLKALDDFVVRKEQVISDYHSKTSVTITFTRKSVFNMRNMSN